MKYEQATGQTTFTQPLTFSDLEQNSANKKDTINTSNSSWYRIGMHNVLLKNILN